VISPHISKGTLRKPFLVVLNKLDAVDPENASEWAKALRKVPGISAIVGYSKEDLSNRDFPELQVGKDALIET